MTDKKKITKNEFQKLVQKIIDDIGPSEIVIDEEELKKFCELTGHDYSIYADKGFIPQGYLMTLTIPAMNQFFIKGVPELIPGVLTGVIHTWSKVEYYMPIETSGKYVGRIDVTNIVEKTGKQGDYFVTDFEILVENEAGEKTASDVHQFFLRI